MRKTLNMFKEGKESAELQLNCTVAHMADSLNTYKRGCDEIVARKDREINDVKTKLTSENEILKMKVIHLESRLSAQVLVAIK